MGCCQSRDVQEIDGGQPPRQAQAAQPSNGQVPRSLSDAGSNRAIAPSDDATSEPLRPPTPLSQSPSELLQVPPPWTRSTLESQRREFFATRIGGDPEAWVTIERICEFLRQSPPAVAEAQAVLDAAGLRCVRGRIASNKGRNRRHGGVYDWRGHSYSIPAWVVTDPQDIIDEGAEKDAVDEASGTAEDSDDEDLKAPQSPREEKGKGRAQSPGRLLQVKCRRSDRGKDTIVSHSEKDPAAALLARLQDKIRDDRGVRLMLGGKRVDLSKTLAEQGWKDGQVINAFVTEPSPGS